MSSARGRGGSTVALAQRMLSNTVRFRSTCILFAALILQATSADAQVPERLMSKLDSRLSSSVRARQSDTKRVIIRTTSKGITQLTDALKEQLSNRPVYGYLFEGSRYDGGDKVGYLKATVELALKNPSLKKEFKEYLASRMPSIMEKE